MSTGTSTKLVAMFAVYGVPEELATNVARVFTSFEVKHSWPVTVSDIGCHQLITLTKTIGLSYVLKPWNYCTAGT